MTLGPAQGEISASSDGNLDQYEVRPGPAVL